MTTNTNDWYLENLANGSPKGMEAIKNDCYPGIARFIKSHGGTEQDAEDIFMDGVVAIFRKTKAGPVTLSCKFSVFLFQICKNLWYKQVRRKKFQSDIEIEDANPEYITEEWIPAIEKTARLSLLQEKFLKISAKCQELLRLSWHSEMSLQDIASSMGIEYGTARKRKFDCNKKLTELVQADPRFVELK